MVAYGQFVIGPPGCGKTTYCEGIRQILSGLRRPCLVINLDFANDWLAKIDYARESRGAICEFAPPDVDVRKLNTIEQIMREHHLGPNGALIFAYKELARNVDWLKEEIERAKAKAQVDHRKSASCHHDPLSPAYLLFDLPGQVELYTIDSSLLEIIKALNDKDKGIRGVAVHLVDATLCNKIDHYIAALLVSLSAQMTLELPFINVLSKVDLVKESELADGTFDLEWFTRAEDLQYLLPVAHPAAADGAKAANSREVKFAQFHERILELVEDFSLTSFVPLNIQDKEMTLAVLALADRANGFAMSAYIK